MLRAGSVPYLVGRPLDLGLGEEPGIELTLAPPSRLVSGLRDGSLDVALVSSIELFRRPGYSFLDRIAVSGTGFVSSVQVFLRKELSEVESIALDPASRTSIALLQIVWPRRAGRPLPRLVELPHGAAPHEAETDAWLVIGDAALRTYLGPESPPVFNPSEAWVAATGHPFVFAAWIARQGVDLAPHVPAFLRARARGAAAAAALAGEAAALWRLPLDATRRYLLNECVYELDSGLAASLYRFRDAAAELGMANGAAAPRAIPVDGGTADPEAAPAAEERVGTDPES